MSFDRPRWNAIAVLAVLAVFTILTTLATTTHAAEAPLDLGLRQPVQSSPHFVLYSHFGFNLYDELLAQGAAHLREGEAPRLDESCFSELSREERSAWEAAVGYYAEALASTSTFSRERFVVRAHLAEIDLEMAADDRRDLDLALLFLRAAAPAYRACRWEAQDAANRRWIAAVLPLLEEHGAEVARRVTAAAEAEWRQLPIPVDVVRVGGRHGADTVGWPATHVRINSTDSTYQGFASLEMLFHEASHELISPRNGPTARLIAKLSKEVGQEPDRNLWHAVLFANAGEATRQVLAEAGEDYVPYAKAHGVFHGYEPALEAHWLPFLRGEVEREAAMRRVVQALGAAPP